MARSFETDISVVKELGENEEILWKGAPEEFPLVTAENKSNLYRRWILCIAAAVIVIAGYIVLNTITGGLNVWVLIIALLAVAYVAALPLIDKNNIFKKCKYYISEQRVIFHYADRDIYSLPLKGLKYEIHNAGKGCIHIDLGSCVGIKGKKRRTAAFVPKKDDNDNVTGLVLYNVEDNETLRKTFF